MLITLGVLAFELRRRYFRFKQSSPRDDSQLTGERKVACRDVVEILSLVGRRVLHALERGVSNTLLGDQRVHGRRDRIGLDSAVVLLRLSARRQSLGQARYRGHLEFAHQHRRSRRPDRC